MKIGVFRARFISKTVQDMAIVTTEDEKELVCDDLEWRALT